jgi:hypothetical protein
MAVGLAIADPLIGLAVTVVILRIERASCNTVRLDRSRQTDRYLDLVSRSGLNRGDKEVLACRLELSRFGRCCA